MGETGGDEGDEDFFARSCRVRLMVQNLRFLKSAR
jgi:hypothetical protein